MNRGEAIERLKQNKEVCVKVSAFGDDNLACIDAMIEVLKNRDNEFDIVCKFGDDKSLFDAAMSALELMENDFEDIEEYLYPVL